MKETLDVALIGYGYAGKTFHAPLIASVPGLRLAAVGSRDPAKVHADRPAVVVERDAADLLAMPIDLVVIATPNDTHFDLARRALAAGKHVVVDKPFTVTLAEARELAALAKQRGRILSVFHNRRWDGDFLTVRRLIASGALGDVAYFESHFDRYRPRVRARWREQPGGGGGLWYDLGPHLVDQALQLGDDLRDVVTVHDDRHAGEPRRFGGSDGERLDVEAAATEQRHGAVEDTGTVLHDGDQGVQHCEPR